MSNAGMSVPKKTFIAGRWKFDKDSDGHSDSDSA